MHNAVTLDTEVFNALLQERGHTTAKSAADSLGLSLSFFQQVRSGARGVSILFVSRVFSQWGVPFNPGVHGSIYRYTVEEKRFQEKNNFLDIL